MAIIFLNSQIKASDPRAVEFIDQLVKSGAAYTGEIPKGFITCIDKKICCSEIPWEGRDIIASNEYGNFYTVQSHKHGDNGVIMNKEGDGKTIEFETIEVNLEKLKMVVDVLNTLYIATSSKVLPAKMNTNDLEIDKIYQLALKCLGNAAAR